MSADLSPWRSIRRRARLIASLAALLVAAGGCWRASPTPPPPVPAPPAPTRGPVAATTPAGSAQSEGSGESADQSPPVAAEETTPSDSTGETPAEEQVAANASGSPEALPVEASEDANAAAASVEEAAPAPRRDARLLVATPGGLTIVDAELVVEGESPQQALDAFVADILELADTNDDGTPTWDEVFADAVFKAGTLGNDAIPGEPEAKRARELYDNNRDNVVQGEEVPRFVTRNAGAARSFTLQSANFFRFYQKTESALRLIADADRDGKVTRAELVQTPRELSVYDADDDEILTADEIEMDDRESFRQQRPLNSRTDPETALLVDDRLKTEDLKRWLSETYAFSGSLEPGLFPNRPALEAAIDANGDGKFVDAELDALRTLPADVVVRIEFGAATPPDVESPGEGDPANLYMQRAGGGTRVSIVQAPAAGEGGVEIATVRSNASVPSRAVLELEGVLLRIAANDGAPSYGQAEAIFRQTDTNGDDQIDKAERDASPFLLQVPAEAVDLDQDEIYTRDEVAGYFRRVAGSQRAKVRALAMEDRDALLVALDKNLDGRIQPGERGDLETLLERYDANEDDQLSTGELPAALSLTFVRGDLQQSEELFRRAPERLASPAAGEAPAWLAQMDRNEDGVVTRREFPGPSEKFAQLDADGDGEIVPTEATAATETSSEPASPETAEGEAAAEETGEATEASP